MKTPSEIADLKRQWLRDPCWVIETTEGFEEHWEELTAFAREQAGRWLKQDQDREQDQAVKAARYARVTQSLGWGRDAVWMVKLLDGMAQDLTAISARLGRIADAMEEGR